MTATEKSQVKNAPLEFDDDRSDFVEWATSVADGAVAAGWQSLHPHLASQRDDTWVLEMSKLEEGRTLGVGGLAGEMKLTQTETSRLSLAKFVELSRRQLGQSVEQLAKDAGVGLAELLAVETGKGVIHPQTVQQLATFLKANPQKLLQLAGLVPAENRELEQAALQFAARTESVMPLEPQERAALEEFCDEVFAVESTEG
jgi:transcriptional regulator with XRE-family HTH domain